MADNTVGRQNSGLTTSSEVLVYDPSSANKSLIDDRPNLGDAQPLHFRPRAMYFPVAGTIVMTFPGQSAQTFTVTAGALLPYAPISTTASGTTVTECHAIY